MKNLLLICSILAVVLMASAEEKTGTVLYFRSAIITPGFPRPKEPQLSPAESEAIKQGQERRYAYVEAYYSPAGLLEKMQKVFKGKVLWKYEFTYADGEVIRIMEYDSKGRASVTYDFRSK
ncbi:MAG: hypothetical protein WC378_00595 [Opitutaceae bacterium]